MYAKNYAIDIPLVDKSTGTGVLEEVKTFYLIMEANFKNHCSLKLAPN